MGTGVAGLFIGLVRFVLLNIFGISKKGIIVGIFIYFSIATTIIFLTVILHTFFVKSEFCKHYLEKIRTDLIDMNDEDILRENYHELKEICPDKKFKSFDKRFELKNIQIDVYSVFRKIFPMPFIIWITYLQTFMMFPGLTLKKKV